jgi:hypothetical protein
LEHQLLYSKSHGLSFSRRLFPHHLDGKTT